MEKIKKIIQNKYLYYIIAMMLFLLLSITDLRAKIGNQQMLFDTHQIVFITLYVVLSVVLLLVIKLKKIDNNNIHKFFFVLGLLLGILYLIASPLFTGSDEHNHYYRIYEISDGMLVTPVSNKTVGGKLPKSLYSTFVNKDKEEINRNIRIKYKDEIEMSKYQLNEDEKIQYGKKYATEYSNTALYNPIQYIPQVIGFSIGKLFNLSPFYIGKLGRLFNLLFYIVICSLFLKKLPRLKTFATLVLLSPTLLSNATTLSADAFTNSLIFGFLVMIVNNCYDDRIIELKEKLLYFILSILLASCKIVYLPLIFLLFILPRNRFKSSKQKILFIITCLLSSIAIGALWLKITEPYFDVYYVNTNLQKNNILNNIIWYLSVVVRTYFKQFNSLVLNLFVGDNMYHCQLNVYSLISMVYIVVVIISYFIKEEKDKYNKVLKNWIQSVLSYVVMLVILALITTAIYVQCTANFIAVNNPVVGGLQGRYYLALVLCVLLVGSKEKIEFNIKNNGLLIDISIIIQLFTLSQMVVQFII